MLEHIQRGDIYEANFCMEFYAENAKIDPLEIYHKLNTISEPPFAVYFKNQDNFHDFRNFEVLDCPQINIIPLTGSSGGFFAIQKIEFYQLFF